MNALVIGWIGAGKSSFINSTLSVLKNSFVSECLFGESKTSFT